MQLACGCTKKKNKRKIWNRCLFPLQKFVKLLDEVNNSISLYLDGHIHSLGGLNDENLIGLLSRITELEESDRETIHLLVFMLMQFMSRTDQAYPSEDKPVTKTQNIVLKHLFLLLGHNQMDKTFHTTPESLRWVQKVRFMNQKSIVQTWIYPQ